MSLTRRFRGGGRALSLLLTLAGLGTAACRPQGQPDDLEKPVDRPPVVPDLIIPDDQDGGLTDGEVPWVGDRPLYSDGLAVIQLVTDPELNRDEYTPAQITYRGHRYIGAQAKYRGQSAYAYPKKSFTLKFDDEDPLKDADGRPGAIINPRKIALVASFDDNSYLRHALAFELWNRADPAHLQVHTRFAVLELNGSYHGLYLMVDHIDEHLMEAQGLWEDGNLYKARTHQATFRTTTGTGQARSPHLGFTKEHGAPEAGEAGAYADFDAFAGWLNTATEARFDAELAQHIAVDEYADWWILVTLIDARDSAGKNSYHYHDPREAAAPAPFHCVPWDFNASFGQGFNTKRVRPTMELDTYQRRNQIFDRMLRSRTWGPMLIERYQRLLSSELSLRDVQRWVQITRPKIERAARHDEERWGADYRSYKTWEARTDFTDFETESAYLDQWIAERWPFVAQEMDAR